jgi:methylglyoxal synthase
MLSYIPHGTLPPQLMRYVKINIIFVISMVDVVKNDMQHDNIRKINKLGFVFDIPHAWNTKSVDEIRQNKYHNRNQHG